MAQLNWHHSPTLVEAALERILPAPSVNEEEGFAALQSAMRYAVLGNGKRTRPLLLLESASAAHRAVCGPQARFDPNFALDAACAVELIHAYSLVHDDLPAMDNSDLRRGQPTCHKMYGDAIAVLAGDALQTLAFEILATRPHVPPIHTWQEIYGDSPENQLRVTGLIAQAAGISGMAGGQAIDIAWSNQGGNLSINGAQLLRLHALKTGAMLRVCAEAGAILGGGETSHVTALRTYGEHVGRAFQIWDDVLDATGDPDVMGKAATDSDNDKMTAIAIWGVSGAKTRALESSDAAIAALTNFGSEADTLRDLARFVVNRDK